LRSRRLPSAALLALAATLVVALLAGCGAGTSTVIFKDKTTESSEAEPGGESGATTAEVEAEAEGEVPPQVPSELAVEASSPGFNAAQIYREAGPGVVTIRSVFGGAAGGAEGSGFVLASNGEIVTNAHVVTQESGGEGSGGAREPATEVFVEFENRNVLEAEIVGFDPFADVALLKVEPAGFALHPLELGNDAEVEVGEPVRRSAAPSASSARSRSASSRPPTGR
jgi:S1-C subfamily serine protease